MDLEEIKENLVEKEKPLCQKGLAQPNLVASSKLQLFLLKQSLQTQATLKEL